MFLDFVYRNLYPLDEGELHDYSILTLRNNVTRDSSFFISSGEKWKLIVRDNQLLINYRWTIISLSIDQGKRERAFP